MLTDEPRLSRTNPIDISGMQNCPQLPNLVEWRNFYTSRCWGRVGTANTSLIVKDGGHNVCALPALWDVRIYGYELLLWGYSWFYFYLPSRRTIRAERAPASSAGYEADAVTSILGSIFITLTRVANAVACSTAAWHLSDRVSEMRVILTRHHLHLLITFALCALVASLLINGRSQLPAAVRPC